MKYQYDAFYSDISRFFSNHFYSVWLKICSIFPLSFIMKPNDYQRFYKRIIWIYYIIILLYYFNFLKDYLQVQTWREYNYILVVILYSTISSELNGNKGIAAYVAWDSKTWYNRRLLGCFLLLQIIWRSIQSLQNHHINKSPVQFLFNF